MRSPPVKALAKIRPRPTHDRAVDDIVAGYAALGRQERREARFRKSAFAGLAAAAAAAAGAVWLSDAPRAILDEGTAADDAARELRELVSAGLAELSVARAELATARDELAAERDRYNGNSAALERELAALTERHAELERRQALLGEQTETLRAALAGIDAERDALLASSRTRDSDVAQELAAVAEQRRELEQRWDSFSSESLRLSDELARLERQRGALEQERAAMDQQRRELEALIEDASRASETTSRVADPRLDPSLEPLFASAVETPALGDMRGGVQLANGMNIAIGLTRSASINGVEQYSSSLRLDGLTAGMDSAALDAIGTNVIQNGSGNYLAPNVLDGLSSGFGTIIQNSLDGQEIRTSTTYDVAISDVSSAIRDIAAAQAISDTLTLNQ
jgi:hypothetical protein